MEEGLGDSCIQYIGKGIIFPPVVGEGKKVWKINSLALPLQGSKHTHTQVDVDAVCREGP